MRIIQLLFLFILFSGCSSTAPRVPEKFSITIKEKYESAYDYYDSGENEYERSYIKGNKRIKVRLSEQEKDSILALLKESDFLNFPYRFEPVPNNDGMIEMTGSPGSTIVISATVNGENKTVIYDGQYTSEEYKNKTEKFRNLTKQIWKVIQNNSEVKSLKQTDWVFM